MLLSQGISHIVHSAAETSIMKSREELWQINVKGTENVVNFARSISSDRTCCIAYVSTAYVAGRRCGEIREDDPLPTAFYSHYEESKAEGEKIVRQSGLDDSSPRHDCGQQHHRTNTQLQHSVLCDEANAARQAALHASIVTANGQHRTSRLCCESICATPVQRESHWQSVSPHSIGVANAAQPTLARQSLHSRCNHPASVTRLAANPHNNGIGKKNSKEHHAIKTNP